MQDFELRDQFDEWAGPLRATPAPDVAALRSRVRGRRARIGAAAGSSLAVVGLVAGLLVAGGLAGSGKPGGPAPQPGGSAKYPAPPGQPYVFVNSSATFVNVGDAPTVPAELRNAATGKVVKVLRPIGQGTSFTGAAVAPGDRVFVLAELDNNEKPSFAEIRIDGSGKAGALRQVMPGLSLPAGTQPENMTVNAPLTRLSFFAAAANGLSGSLVVYNLQAGALIASWPVSGNNFANSQFVGYGDELVVSDSSVTQGQNRLVDTSNAFRPGSPLLADSRPDRAGAGGFPGSFTQDGNLSAVASIDRLVDGQPAGPELLIEYSVTSGKVLRKIPIGQSSDTNGPDFCGVLWASANGGEVWTQCGTRQLIIAGSHVTQVRLAWVLPSNPGSDISTFAW